MKTFPGHKFNMGQIIASALGHKTLWLLMFSHNIFKSLFHMSPFKTQKCLVNSNRRNQ